MFAGGCIDLSAKGKGPGRVGTFVTVIGGYAFAAVTEPSRAGAGPIADVSLGYGIQEDIAAAWVRLHGRFGLVPDNRDLRAVFLSIGYGSTAAAGETAISRGCRAAARA